MPSPSLSLSNQELQITETELSSEPISVIMEVDEPLVMSEESYPALTVVSTAESSSTCEQAPQTVQNTIKSVTSEENFTTVTVPSSVSVWKTPNISSSNSTVSIGTEALFDITSQSDQSHMSLHSSLPSVMSHHSHLSDVEARTGRNMNNIDYQIQELEHSKSESSTLFMSSTQLSVHSIGGHVNSKLLNSKMSDSVTLQVEGHGIFVESPLKKSDSNKFASLQPSKTTPQIHPSHTSYYSPKHTAVNIDCDDSDECMDGSLSTLSNTSIIISPSNVSCTSEDYYSAYETLEFST